LEKIPEFRNSSEMTSKTYADAVGSLALPSQSVRATPNFAGSEAVNKHLVGKMPGNLVFKTSSLMGDSQITGADLAKAGAVVDNVYLMTQPLNGQLGYQVTIGRADKSTPLDLEEIGGSTTLILAGDQLRTAGLEAVASDPMNLLLIDLDALRISGDSNGSIPLTGGYTIDVQNFNPDNPFGANVRVRETVSGKAVLPVTDPATGNTSFLTLSSDNPKYSLTNMPLNSPNFEQILNLRNDAGLPALFYGN
jgi:hypothetical protein